DIQIEHRCLPTLDLGLINKQIFSPHHHHHRQRPPTVAHSPMSPHHHRHMIATVNVRPRP
ncbi:hypothetical protein K443DRAFT_35608, partial [Laccaria amethystina LaAM-08-1]